MINSDKMRFHHWLSSLEITITEGGRHKIPFSKDFPLLIKLYEFLVDHRITPNCHDYLEITYIYEGTGIFIVENKRYPVKKPKTFPGANSHPLSVFVTTSSSICF